MFSYTKFDPPINHIPLMIVSLFQKVEYLYWDSDNKQIRQTNDKVVAINCSSLPFLKTTYSSKYVFFVTDQNDIVRFDPKAYGKPGVIVFKESEHRVKHIDCVSDLNDLKQVSFVIWSLATQSLTLMSCDQVLGVVGFKSRFEFFSVPYLGNEPQFLVTAFIPLDNMKDKFF